MESGSVTGYPDFGLEYPKNGEKRECHECVLITIERPVRHWSSWEAYPYMLFAHSLGSAT